ncbi:hypothetical protein [Vibrio hepatarius]|uniref:Uncharacterized protein n=1 Tax=Vibrio hepatarius TaxID=171383 RepID=A0A0M0I562_9VIBR|nr:hypothetical protein [Vibrio hepatarius]KOO09446.1 hypothetical protein AKJ31_03585 [Vibrio hepatarius]
MRAQIDQLMPHQYTGSYIDGNNGLVHLEQDQGEVIQDTTLTYIHEQAGYVSVVKATKSGKGVFLSSFRRLSSNEAKRTD